MLIVYGDTIFQADLTRVLERDGDGHLGVKRVEDPRRFGVVVEKDGIVTRLVEKPTQFVSDMAIVGVNHIRRSAQLFDCLDALIESQERTRGEFQLCEKPQSEPAMTFSLPTSRAKFLRRSATSSGCSTMFVAWLKTPGISNFPSGSGVSSQICHSCS